MTLLGMILMIIGAILFYGSRIVSKRNEKKIGKSDVEYVTLINNAMLASRTIGALLVITGGILIIFIK